MKYSGKTSDELSETEFSELSYLFNHVFHKDISVSFLKKKYHSPLLDKSYHGLMYNDAGNIAGALTFIPFLYRFFDTPIVAGCAVDLMIHEDYRNDFLSVKLMHDLAIEKSENAIDFVFAVPNSNSFLYYMKFLKWHKIGQLNYYIQVLNVSVLKKKLSAFSAISRGLSGCLNVLYPVFGTKSDEQKKPVSKVCNMIYNTYRYNQRYNEISRDTNSAYYSVIDESGIKTAYIIDLFPVSERWIGQVVKIIHASEKKNVDIILYVGNKINVPCNLFKVPRKFEPRDLHLIGNILTSKVDSRIYDLTNWNFNLSDIDVR